MVICRAIKLRTGLALIVMGTAILACSAPARLGRMLQRSADNGQSFESQPPAVAGNPSVPALLPEFQGDEAALAALLPRYEIDLAVDFEAATIQGNSVVTITNTESIPLDSLYFRLFPNGHESYGDGSLTVTATQVEGKAVETVSSLSDSVLKVRLPQELAPGARTHIEFQFSGIIPEDFGGGPDSTGYGIYNKSQEVMALSGWYPLLAVYDEEGWNLDPVSAIGDSVYSETALYDVEVTTPKDMVLVSSGVEAGIQEEGDRLRHHLVGGPLRDFFMIMSPDYKRKSRTVDGVLVNSYYQFGSTDGGERALAVASQALQLYNSRFGSYPYSELDIVEAPMMYAQGVEYPTIVLVGSDLYRNPKDGFFSDVVAHEVAHQWWYGLVGNDVFDDPWLDEALAMYSDGLFLEETYGSAAYNGFIQYLTAEYDSLVKDGMDERITQSLGYFEGLNNPRLYSGIVYSKGALFLHALRKEIGDEMFFQALQDYFQAQRYGVARPDDLLRAFEAAAGRSLSDFYEAWLYTSEN
jgi:hypothetical protein